MSFKLILATIIGSKTPPYFWGTYNFFVYLKCQPNHFFDACLCLRLCSEVLPVSEVHQLSHTKRGLFAKRRKSWSQAQETNALQTTTKNENLLYGVQLWNRADCESGPLMDYRQPAQTNNYPTWKHFDAKTKQLKLFEGPTNGGM